VTWIANALALLASIAYGAADFLGGLATKRGSTVFPAVVCSQATGLLLVLLASPFSRRLRPPHPISRGAPRAGSPAESASRSSIAAWPSA
jgi:hypothetical protein